MLAHLHTTYGSITQAKLETNRNCLTANWTPEDPIEDLWLRIWEIQCFALAGNEPISDSTALYLTLEVLEKTGVFISATECCCKIDEATWWMLPNFQLHFTKAEKECCHKLTAQTAGYHGAHTATMPNNAPLTAATITSANPAAPFTASMLMAAPCIIAGPTVSAKMPPTPASHVTTSPPATRTPPL
jgi:hypothetical protein